MAESGKVPIDWSIKNLDHGELIRPQMPMPSDGVSFSVGSRLVDQNLFGEQNSPTNYTGGLPRDFTFTCILYSRDSEEALDVEDLLDQLIELTTKDDSLGRIPICIFNYGTYLSETVLVERVDPTIISVDSSGYVKETRCSMALKRYTPFSQSQIDPTKPAKESYLRVAAQGEQMWEAIARTYYGDPLLGDRLRKRHPQHPFFVPVGETVSVPAKSILQKEVVKPAYHAFDPDNEAAVANYERILADRNARVVVEVK